MGLSFVNFCIYSDENESFRDSNFGRESSVLKHTMPRAICNVLKHTMPRAICNLFLFVEIEKFKVEASVKTKTMCFLIALYCSLFVGIISLLRNLQCQSLHAC